MREARIDGLTESSLFCSANPKWNILVVENCYRGEHKLQDFVDRELRTITGFQTMIYYTV